MQHLVTRQLFPSPCVHELLKKKNAQMIEPPLLSKHKADRVAGKNTFTACVVTQLDRKFSLWMGSFLHDVLLLTQISKNGCQPNICWQHWNLWLKPLENVKGYSGNPNVRLRSNTKRDAEARNIHTWDHCIDIISFQKELALFVKKKKKRVRVQIRLGKSSWKHSSNFSLVSVWTHRQRKFLWFCQTFK